MVGVVNPVDWVQRLVVEEEVEQVVVVAFFAVADLMIW